MNESELLKQNAELRALLADAQALGLRFFIGTAYISRRYITSQDELNARIDAALRDA
jgi:hypothetical protein